MNYQEFLADVADEIGELISKPRVKQWFIKHIESYLKCYRTSAQQREPFTRRELPSGGKEIQVGLPSDPGDASEWLMPYRLWTDEPTSPISKHLFRPPTKAENLDAQFTLLAIIHDGQRQKSHPDHKIYFHWQGKKFFEDTNQQLAGCVWTAWSKNPEAFEGRESYCRKGIEKALEMVKANLAHSSFRKIIGWIFKKTSHFICAIIVAVIATIIAAIIVDIFADFGWIERIKHLFTR